MAYFDFHCHPSLKASLSEPELNLTCWSHFQVDKNAPGFIKSFRNVVDSQSNFTQLRKGKFELVVSVLIGVEEAFAKNILLRKSLPRHSPMDDEILQDVCDGKVTYFEVLNRDFSVLEKSILERSNEVNLLEKAEDLDPNKLNLIVAVEGIHSFRGARPEGHRITEKEIESYLENFRHFRKGKKILYITLTHLSRERAANHAFGVKAKVGTGQGTDTEFDDIEITVLGGRQFKPHKSLKGITKLGHAFIEECYETQEKEKVVLIDLKHLSWYGRQEFYKLRKANADRKWDKIPLIATHMGVTGTSLKSGTKAQKKLISWGKIKRIKFWKKKGLDGTHFNPWSINLYDEDIVEILESKGLIGVSIDQRIVGSTKVFKELMNKPEYREFNKFLSMSWRRPSGYLKSNDNKPNISTRDCFINNLLHIIKVGISHGFNGTNGKVNVWEHICLGSDLDGLIDPVDLYESKKGQQVTAENFSVFAEYIRSKMPMMVQRDPVLKEQMDDLDQKLEKFFLTNGKSFVLKFLEGSVFDW